MKVNELKECPVCNNTDWQSMDDLRDHEYWFNKDWLFDEPVGFKVCKDCGFVTYDYRDLKELAEHYEQERPVMSHANIITCNRKNVYHSEFLQDVVKDDMKCLDVGCAQGSYLNLLNKKFGVPKENLFGTEWSSSFGAFAKYEYGVNIEKEIEDFGDIKYDLISYYHVLEHIQYPQKELEKIKKYLAKDGYLYISVPTFFKDLEEPSGGSTMDFENLYHLNHVNVFSDVSFENMLKNAGLRVVKTNKVHYGYAVLCQVDKSIKPDIVKEEYKVIYELLKKQRQAIDCVSSILPKERNIDKALELYPKFPEAHILKSMDFDMLKDFEHVKGILDNALKLMPDNYKLLYQKAILLMQWDEQRPDKTVWYSNNIKLAEQLFKRCLELKPSDDNVMYFLGLINAKYKKKFDIGIEWLRKSLQIDPKRFPEIYNKISLFYKLKEDEKEQE
jgi:SAM-dependent methyltransferase